MDTPELITQDQGDVNNQIAERIALINKMFKGGLGEFFDKLREGRKDSDMSTSPIEALIDQHLSEAAKCGGSSSGGHS